MSEESSDQVAVIKTSDVSFLLVVKSVLESAGIPYFVQGEEALGLFPVGPAGGGMIGKALAAIVRVPRERSEEAKELLADYGEGEPGAET